MFVQEIPSKVHAKLHNFCVNLFLHLHRGHSTDLHFLNVGGLTGDRFLQKLKICAAEIPLQGQTPKTPYISQNAI